MVSEANSITLVGIQDGRSEFITPMSTSYYGRVAAMNCEIQTPMKYVIRLLDEAGYLDDVFGRSVLENSCGNGNILIEIVRRFIEDGQRSGASGEEIREHLEKDIHAYEINPERARESERRLTETARQYGLDHIQWDIRQEDYLQADSGEYDFIIGNPPYITYHDLSQDQRVFLREHFDSCKEGRFDYNYAFIEKSIQSLKENGILAYLIPFSVFRNRFAKVLRGMIYPGLQKIIDFRGEEVFPDVSLTASIIVYRKEDLSPDQKSEGILRKEKEQTAVVTVRRDMVAGCFCEDGKETGITFGELFSVQNSVATLYNDAYLIDPEREDDTYYYLRDGHAIEKTATYRAVSSKTFHKKQEGIGRRIIVPYKLKIGGYKKYSEEEYKTLFPCAYGHLKMYEKVLMGEIT